MHRTLAGVSAAPSNSLRALKPCTYERAQIRQPRPIRLTIVAMGRRAAKNAIRKGKSDALKGKLYGKYGKLILQAAKAGGPDPAANRQLGVLLDQAKSAGVPRDIMDRNIKRSQDKNAADIHEAIYEVYGPGGTGYVCECLTDNGNRTSSEIWTIVKKLEGKMAESGSVLFNFQRRGELVLKGISEEEAFDAAMEASAEDVEPYEGEEDSGWKIVSSVEKFGSVRDALSSMSLQPCAEESGLTYIPLALTEVEDDSAHALNETMYEQLIELDDVDAVYTTCKGVGVNA